MKVKELIEFLQKQDQELPVAFECYSEAMMLSAGDIKIVEACLPRNDGWVHDARPDKATQDYLMLPGN